MKQLSRNTWLALGLVVFLILATALAVFWQTRERIVPALLSSSSEPNGARALFLWLEKKGYQVNAKSGADFMPPEESELVFVLEPYYRLDESHWWILDDWVSAGGVLIIAGQGWGMEQVFSHYDFQMIRSDLGISVTVQTPLLASPPLVDLGNLEARVALTTDRDDFVAFLAVDNTPVLVSFRLGQGSVILASFTYPFTNAGLKEPGNPELILNLLALASPRDHIWLDEWHHEEDQSLSVVGPQDWLRYTPAGRALLWIAIILFLALLLHGRSFGRAVPLPKPVARRTPLETITALANLSRRAGHRTKVLQQYRTTLKNHLSRRYRLDPETPDEIFISQLVEFNPNLNIPALQLLMSRLNKDRVSEAEVVQLAAETAKLLRDFKEFP